MKKQIRFGVFETNSSSTHSLTIVNKDDYEKFENGEMLLDRYKEVLVTKDEAIEKLKRYYKEDEVTDEMLEEDYAEHSYLGGEYYETFKKEFVTKNGDVVVAFGYYGMDN